MNSGPGIVVSPQCTMYNKTGNPTGACSTQDVFGDHEKG